MGYQQFYDGPQTSQTHTGGVKYSTVQPGIQSGLNYEPVRDISHPAPTTKITFGGKNFTETYTPQVQTTYSQVQPAYQQVQTGYVHPVQSYETYRQPAEIAVTSQPIREETRYEHRVEPTN